jgi:hypothetical protein
MSQLSKGEKDGIRLIADYLVIKDIIKNVFKKQQGFEVFAKEYEAFTKEKVPAPFLAGEELEKQIEEVRQQWLKMLSDDIGLNAKRLK